MVELVDEVVDKATAEAEAAAESMGIDVEATKAAAACHRLICFF